MQEKGRHPGQTVGHPPSDAGVRSKERKAPEGSGKAVAGQGPGSFPFVLGHPEVTCSAGPLWQTPVSRSVLPASPGGFPAVPLPASRGSPARRVPGVARGRQWDKCRKWTAVDFLPIVHVPLHCLLPSYLCNARKRNCRVPLSCQSERRASAVTPSPPFICLRQPPSSPFSLYACGLRIPFNTHIRIIVYGYYNI